MRDLEVTYELTADAGTIDSVARDLLLEQTFETPEEVVARYPKVERAGRGNVEQIQDVGGARYRVTLTLPDLNALDAAQVLNVVFGNVSIHAGIRLVGFEPSARMVDRLGGPTHGIQGIRDLLNVPTRPLTATALKPVGLPLKDIVELCRDYAECGIDVIKDDHYLSDQEGCGFDERVHACASIAADASGKLGRPIWYVPNISGTPAHVFSRIDRAVEAGVRCVMLAPMTLGLPVLNEVATRYPDLVILAHPSFSPSSSIAPEILWGRLFRMYGADAIIFVNAGGRFSYTHDVCRLTAAYMVAPLMQCRPALPVPAGGVALDGVEDVIRTYGNDCMLLIGGSLLRAPDRRSAARSLVASVEEHALLAS